MNKPKLRVSYSLLNYWKRGMVANAVSTYLHEDMEISQQMEDGRRIHKEAEDLVRKEKRLPEWAGKFTLIAPKPEEHLRVEYNELFDLSCKLDVLDTPYLYEFKTGKTSALEWSGEAQIPLYFLACNLLKIPVTTAYLIHYNQYTNESEFMPIHNSIEAIERARNEVDTLGPELYDYFLNEGII